LEGAAALDSAVSAVDSRHPAFAAPLSGSAGIVCSGKSELVSGNSGLLGDIVQLARNRHSGSRPKQPGSGSHSVEAAMETDRRMILRLAAMGRITPMEAERLLIAWNEGRETVWALEQFSNFCGVHRGVQGDFFLRKKPLGDIASPLHLIGELL
jgi:uncharacterized protein YjiS (DUF1127 family)